MGDGGSLRRDAMLEVRHWRRGNGDRQIVASGDPQAVPQYILNVPGLKLALVEERGSKRPRPFQQEKCSSADQAPRTDCVVPSSGRRLGFVPGCGRVGNGGLPPAARHLNPDLRRPSSAERFRPRSAEQDRPRSVGQVRRCVARRFECGSNILHRG